MLILFVTTWGRVASPMALYVEQGHIWCCCLINISELGHIKTNPDSSLLISTEGCCLWKYIFYKMGTLPLNIFILQITYSYIAYPKASLPASLSWPPSPLSFHITSVQLLFTSLYLNVNCHNPSIHSVLQIKFGETLSFSWF